MTRRARVHFVTGTGFVLYFVGFMGLSVTLFDCSLPSSVGYACIPFVLFFGPGLLIEGAARWIERAPE